MHSASAVDIYRAQRKHINYSIWPIRISRHDLRRRYSNSLVIDAGSLFTLRACSQAIIMQTLNWTNQCPLFMAVRHIFEISEDDHPPNTPTPLVTHARDHWWNLGFANPFVSPGVNSRGELVPSHGASRCRLGDKRGLKR
jgi:hypothetical protein